MTAEQAATTTPKATYEVFRTSETKIGAEQFAREVCAGLAGRPKRLPAKYFYDERGSELFEQITELDEYYLTAREIEVIDGCKEELTGRMAGEPFRLVELGVGDGRKTRPLIEEFLDHGCRFEFTPIDICHETIAGLTRRLGNELVDPRLNIHGIVAEYCDALGLLHQRDDCRNLVLFLGSSIGNLDKHRALSFLRSLRRSLKDDDLVLIGFDLKKDPRVLQAAYDDSQGVTREFNLNLLDRLNRELGANFDRELFRHHAFYNSVEGRMESWLLSTEPQTIVIEAAEEEVFLDAWEGIHTECSCKYTRAMIESMAASTGFAVEHHYSDPRQWFVDSLWRAA